MFSRKVPEVLIVGAGPVGLFAALALTARGVRVQVVDRGIWACSHSYALALHPGALALFAELGLRDRVLENACPVRAVGIYDRDGQRASICSAEPMPVLRQDVLERLLEKALSAAGVQVSWKHAVPALSQTGDAVTATVDRYAEESRGYVVARSEWMVASSEDVQVPFVIGADGFNSVVRRRLNLDFPEVAPAAYYAVFEFKSDADLGEEMRLVLHDGAPDVLWPVPGGYCRWAFHLPDYHDSEILRAKERQPVSNAARTPVLEQSSMMSLIAARAPWFKGSIGRFTWRTVVRFERRLATAFGRGRMWLAGDAAHVTGPAGVQSMNVGFFEAHDLAETIAPILRDGAPLEGLNAYSERWTAVWRQLHGLERGPVPQPGSDPWLAAHAPALVSCMPAHGEALVPLAAQLGFAI